MPLFHFDVRCDEGWSNDETGVEFPGVDEARGAAIELLSEIAKENLRKCDTLAVRVRDGQPEPLLTFSLALRAEERFGAVQSWPE